MDDIVSYVIGKKKGGVTPTGEIDITQNGVTNVSGYATANVQVPEKQLEEKSVTISSNTTTLIEPSTGKDGMSSVSVTTNVPADLSPYFYTTQGAGTANEPSWFNIIKALPPITIDGTSMAYFFSKAGSGGTTSNYPGCYMEEIPVITNFSSILDFQYVFQGCKRLVNVDLSNRQFNTQITSIQGMFSECTELKKVNLSSFTSMDNTKTGNIINVFYNCNKLEEVDLSNFNPTSNILTTGTFAKCASMKKIDISSFDFSLASNISSMFGQSATSAIPDNCLILVKDQTQKDLVETALSRLTNVQIKSEYIANQGA